MPDTPNAKSVTLDQALSGGPNTLLTPDEVMSILSYSRATLARWRKRREGPAFIKMSRSRVAYRAQDVVNYLDAQRVV